MRRMVLNSHNRGEPGASVGRQPYKLKASAVHSPSRFEMDFVLDGVRHNYGFEASDNKFDSEWLYVFAGTRAQKWFERNAGEFEFGRELKGPRDIIRRLTRPNSLFLSAAAQNGHSQLSEVFLYFKSIRHVSDLEVKNYQVVKTLAGAELDRRAVDLLSKIGTGVVDWRRIDSEKTPESQRFAREFRMMLKDFTGVDVNLEESEARVRVELGHRAADGNVGFFDLSEESTGTRRLLVVLQNAFQAIDAGMPLVVDELEASLHTHAAEAVLRLFCSNETNPKGGQLVATTHDTNLLASQTLREDEVWLTEKDRKGVTRVYPLTDIRIREGDNLEKGYLQGRFGALPFADPIVTFGKN